MDFDFFTSLIVFGILITIAWAIVKKIMPSSPVTSSESDFSPSRSIMRSRMRTGGRAASLNRGDFDTEILFLIALDVALVYDEEYYGDVDFVDSPFEAEYEAEPEIEPEVVSTYIEPEADTYEDLSSDDDDTISGGWGGSDDSDSGWGGSDDSSWDD